MLLSHMQRRILEMLSDGIAHNRDEIKTCLWDELSGPSAVRVAIFRLKQKLRPIGQDIICEISYTPHQTIRYRLVELIPSPCDGKR